MGFSLDWLSFSFKPTPEMYREGMDDFSLFLEEFPKIADNMDDALIMSRTRFYDHVLKVNDHIMISYCDEDLSGYGQGVNVSIPSCGLAILFDWFDLPDNRDTLKELFLYLQEHHCQLSRLDLAYDDYSKMITPKDYARWYMDGWMSTKYSKIQFVASERDKGHTFYLGSRKTGKMLRVYDKEYESKGEINAIRYEFELHREFAREMMDYIIEHDTIDFGSYLLSYFDIKDITVNKDKSRAPREEKFAEWLKSQIFIQQIDGEIEPISVPHKYRNPTLESRMDWVFNVALRNIKIACEVFGKEYVLNAVREKDLSDEDIYLLEQCHNQLAL